MHDDFAEFIAHLSENARTSLYHADSIARGYGSRYIGTEHLLLGVLAQGSSVGAKVLADAGVTLDKAEMALGLKPVAQAVHIGVNMLSETAKMTLKMSWQLAQEYNQNHLGTEHILYSILSQKNSRATVLLRDMKVGVNEVINDLDTFFQRQGNFEQPEIIIQTDLPPRGKKSVLDLFGDDLTARAKADALDPMIGRDAELERMVTILSRRTKNNPVLIGEPGVGKTAIVEGLAQRIVREEVPDHLLDKRIIQLDLAGMIAGTKYRGEFEDRLKKVIEALRRDDEVIAFIDELHLLVGAGAAEGAMDAANLLKPALARGELRLIGSTTLDEHRKHIEKDAALERRFQAIVVKEPKKREAVAILKGLRPHYEKHHSVTMSDETIEDAVYMADRYIKDHFMPDKAIDVMDEAAALVRVQHGKKPSKLRDLTKELKHLNEKMEEAVASEQYERAALYKMRSSQIKEKIEKLKESLAKKTSTSLTNNHLARAISNMTGIPVTRVQKSEARLLKNLEKHLAKHVVGQDEAIKQVARAIRRGRSGIGTGRRPIGSFVFMGPTGVGKTELARVLAREVFGSDEALIKIDMSEFAEKHNTARLVGAPAGYVGYEDGGHLTDKIRRQPYSVVLFDEIEKAHPSVFHMLLQLLEDGKLTDASGREVDFSNTIIILTSNLGSEAMRKESVLGFSVQSRKDEDKLDAAHERNAAAAKEALERFMKPELINRFDGVIVFRALTRKVVAKIFDVMINELKERLVRQGLSLKLQPSVKKRLIDLGYDEYNGARPLRRVIEEKLEHPIAEKIISGEFDKGCIIHATTKKGRIIVEGRYE